jgi:surface polysaccharide O-acyltransferase-like enzyme
MVFREDGLGPTLTAQAAKSLGTLWAQHITLLLIPQPPIYHLWFLPALVMALALVRAVMVHGLERIVTGCMVGLYVISIATEVAETYVTVSYPPTMYALAMLFTLLGWWLSRQVLPSASMSLWLIAGGYLLAFAEAAMLKIAFHASSHAIAFHSYAGAIVMVTGIFLFLLAKPTWGEQSILPRLARFTLGVYVSHILIHNALTPLYTSLPRRPAIWHLAYGCAVYGISVLFTVVFSHLPGLGWFVSRQNVGTHQIMNRLRDLRLKRSA